jgi:hypothetical protein
MIAEKYEDGPVSAEECMSNVSNYLRQGGRQMSQMVQERPARSLMVCCLAGFGMGWVLSRILVDEKPPSSSFDRGTAERFGRQLLDKVEQAMPNMLRERFIK